MPDDCAKYLDGRRAGSRYDGSCAVSMLIGQASTFVATKHCSDSVGALDAIALLGIFFVSLTSRVYIYNRDIFRFLQLLYLPTPCVVRSTPT